MRWVQSEYALKGLFLGLLLYAAVQIQLPDAIGVTPAPWHTAGQLAVYMLIGLGAAIAIGGLRQLIDLVGILKKPHAGVLFLLLENPLLIYAGLIGGLAVGVGILFDPEKANLFVLAIGGAILGYGFSQLSDIKDFRFRHSLAIAVGAGVVYAIMMWLDGVEGGFFVKDPEHSAARARLLGYHLLLGLPFFYLLCFVGVAEESEAEIASFCTILGLAIHLIKFPENVPSAGAAVPIAVYFAYIFYALPKLRIFKYTLRGYSYMEIGRLRPALTAFRRALELDPGNQLAHLGMDHLHSNIEIDKVDARTLGLLDPSRCLNRARALLGQTPTPEQLKKALHLLDLVEKLWPKLISHVIYYRAVAALHAHELDKACDFLNDLIAPEGWFAGDSSRLTILFDAWQLVLLVHPVLKQRVGEPQLALTGRRVEAIGAVERQLALQPDESAILELRRSLYTDLQELEYFDAAKGAPPADFSHRYAEELGLSLIGNSEQWQRGAQFLRMAANGQPLRRPSILQRLADACAKAGDAAQSLKYLQMVRDFALEVGVQNLPADQRAVYFATVKRLGDEASARNDSDEAIYNYGLSTHDPASGVPTLRALAEQYEKRKDVMNALRITEKALCHDGRDPDLLAKKDKYYYSLDTADLAIRAREDDNVRKYFDVGYCFKKAKGVLDAKTDDLDTLEWVQHLVTLALVMQPKNLAALVQKARLHLRRGERNEGLTILEDVREMKPSGAEETDAWFYVQKQLGTLYLDELNRADLAIPCFLEYLNDVKSGGETHYQLGLAYEAVGDKSNAIKHYNMVTAYDGHPRMWDAQAAVRRLKGE